MFNFKTLTVASLVAVLSVGCSKNEQQVVSPSMVVKPVLGWLLKSPKFTKKPLVNWLNHYLTLNCGHSLKQKY